jgi:hypothetical protein
MSDRKEYQREYQRQRYVNDPEYRERKREQARLRRALNIEGRERRRPAGWATEEKAAALLADNMLLRRTLAEVKAELAKEKRARYDLAVHIRTALLEVAPWLT